MKIDGYLHFPDLATAGRELPVGFMGSFNAFHCDPLYNAAEQLRMWRFDIVQNDAEAFKVRRQYRNNYIDLSGYRNCDHFGNGAAPSPNHLRIDR